MKMKLQMPSYLNLRKIMHLHNRHATGYELGLFHNSLSIHINTFNNGIGSLTNFYRGMDLCPEDIVDSDL